MPTGQVWLITGSSRGFGRSLARAVLAVGHQLIDTARSTDSLVDLVKRYGDQGARRGRCPMARAERIGRLSRRRARRLIA